MSCRAATMTFSSAKSLRVTPAMASRSSILRESTAPSPTSRRRLDRASNSRASIMRGKWIPQLVLVSLSLAAICSSALSAQPPQSDAAGVEFFEKEIRPVLVERCYECHSSQAKKLKGGLRLDSREGLRKGGDSGPVIVPGEPDK